MPYYVQPDPESFIGYRPTIENSMGASVEEGVSMISQKIYLDGPIEPLDLLAALYKLSNRNVHCPVDQNSKAILNELGISPQWDGPRQIITLTFKDGKELMIHADEYRRAIGVKG